jgi:hypothetical protein
MWNVFPFARSDGGGVQLIARQSVMNANGFAGLPAGGQSGRAGEADPANVSGTRVLTGTCDHHPEVRAKASLEG